MTQSITKFDDAFEVLFNSGTFRLQLKDGISHETKLSEKLESLKILIPNNHPNNK